MRISIKVLLARAALAVFIFRVRAFACLLARSHVILAYSTSLSPPPPLIFFSHSGLLQDLVE